jgi:membrane associated rhomboid family serine protease
VDEQEPAIQAQIPRLTRAMKTVAAVLGVVWLLEVLLQGTGIGGARGPMGPFEPLALVPASVLRRGHVWQLATYALLHDPSSALGLVVTVISLWFAGSPLERLWGPRRVLLMLAAASLVGAVAVLGVGAALAAVYTGITVSPAAANTALLAAWCRLHARERLSFFGLATLTGGRLLGLSLAFSVAQFAWQRSGVGVAALAGYAVGWAFASAPARADDAPRRRKESGARFRVIQGGGGRDLPN